MFEKKLAENPLVSVLHRNPKIQDAQRCPVLTASVPTLAWTGMKREGIFCSFDPSVKAKIQTEKGCSCRRTGFCPEDPRLGSHIRPLLSSTLLMWTLPPDLAFRAALIQALSARWTKYQTAPIFRFTHGKKKQKTHLISPFFPNHTMENKTKQNFSVQINWRIPSSWLVCDGFWVLHLRILLFSLPLLRHVLTILVW